jgi:hypothetical protein
MKFKKPNFSKLIVTMTYIWAIGCVSGSYVLALKGLDTNSDVSLEILRLVVAVTLGYLLTKTFEKSSRNKYHLDERGVPFGKSGAENENGTQLGKERDC